MIIKTIAKVLVGVVASATLLFSAGAQAATASVYTKVGTTSTLQTNPYTSPAITFSGATTLKYGILSLSCTLTLNGTLSTSADGTTGSISVTGGSVGGGGLCGTVTLGNFPWSSNTVAASSLASSSVVAGNVPVTFSGIYVNLCGSGLSLSGNFNNNTTSGASPLINSAQSSFAFSSASLVGSSPACSVTGTLTEATASSPSITDIDVVQ